MITRVGANISTQRQNRKNSQNFRALFSEEHKIALATGSSGIGNKVITGISAGVFSHEGEKAKNQQTLRELVEKANGKVNLLLQMAAERMGVLPKTN